MFWPVLLQFVDRDHGQRSPGKGWSEREIHEGSKASEEGFVQLLIRTCIQLQAQGKTEQAQKDMARLAKIRAEREAAQAKRKAEADGMFDNCRTSCSSHHLPCSQGS